MHLGVPHNTDIAGVWALKEFPTGSTLTTAIRNEILAGLNFTNMTGFCARVHVDQLAPTNGAFVSTFLGDLMGVVNSVPNRKFAVRLIGGRYTPAYVFDTLGARGYTVSGGNGRAPHACHTDGTPNSEYITWLGGLATQLKTWMTAQGAGKCPLMHWTWFSNQYSEFYHGPEVRSPNTGYDTSQLNFIAASNSIIDTAYALSDSNLAVSFGMSGTHVEDVQTGVNNHMTTLGGDWSSRLYFSANGLSQTGDWGASTESQQDGNCGMAPTVGPVGKRVSRGEQMIQPGNYSLAYWTGTCDNLIANKADYWEIYTNDGTPVGAPGTSFGGVNAADLQAQINRFVGTFGSGPSGPPDMRLVALPF